MPHKATFLQYYSDQQLQQPLLHLTSEKSIDIECTNQPVTYNKVSTRTQEFWKGQTLYINIVMALKPLLPHRISLFLMGNTSCYEHRFVCWILTEAFKNIIVYYCTSCRQGSAQSQVHRWQCAGKAWYSKEDYISSLKVLFSIEFSPQNDVRYKRR